MTGDCKNQLLTGRFQMPVNVPGLLKGKVFHVLCACGGLGWLVLLLLAKGSRNGKVCGSEHQLLIPSAMAVGFLCQRCMFLWYGGSIA